VKFQRGDLVRAKWFDDRKPGAQCGPAIVIEARFKNWIKVWIPAKNETLVTAGFMLKHYDEARG